ncbi:MAG: MFS transporter, partial [Mycobacterium sp.]|nr:MFS transporter [Mycobacterium sp.]
NIPIGIVGLALAVWLVPELPTQLHRFNPVGVALSGTGIFLVVFGLQQGQSAHWQPWIWAMIVAGIGFVSVFVYWQSVSSREPLVPLAIFRDRDFTLCNVGVAVTAFAMTGLMLPVTFYAQSVCGLSPTRSALLIAPMAVANGVFAPPVGRIVDRCHPRPVLGFGFSMLAIALTWLSFEMRPGTPIWRLVLPLLALGVGNAFLWSPLSATATRNLPPRVSGASSGVYNAVRQLGAVLGSAGMAAFMAARIGAELPPRAVARGGAAALQLPAFLRAPFAAAMSESMLLPAFIALLGIIAALFLVGFRPAPISGHAAGDGPRPVEDDCGGYDDYDDYDELILRRDPGAAGAAGRWRRDDEIDTEPLEERVSRSRPAPEAQHRGPLDAWHGMLDDPVPRAQPTGDTRNGHRVEAGRRFRPITEFTARGFGSGAPGEASRCHPDDDDPSGHGRHSSGD